MVGRVQCGEVAAKMKGRERGAGRWGSIGRAGYVTVPNREKVQIARAKQAL
jgi:hypothetical protein